MKKKNFHKKSRSRMAIAFYYLQLALVSPVLIPMALIRVLSGAVIDFWSAYKDWYLNKTLRR